MPSSPLTLLVPAVSLCAATGMALALRRVRAVRAHAAARRRDAEVRALADHREALREATGGKLHLCGPEEITLLLRGERLWSLPLLEASDVAVFRRHLRQVAARRGLDDGRLNALCSCVSEAAAHAIRRSQGGVAQVWAADDGFRVLVSDCGRSLAPESLLLEATEGGTDMGFRLMLALADSLAVCTGVEGTQLVLTIRGAGSEAGALPGTILSLPPSSTQ